jgi:hypothetical protein
MKITLSIALILGLAACQTVSPYEREMAAIAALKTALDSSLSQTARIDTAAIRRAERQWRQNILLMAAYAKNQADSTGLLSSEVMLRYRQKVADAAWTADHADLLVRELKLTREQLDNLYHDLSYNLLDELGVKEAYRLECAAADSAISRAQRLKSMAAKTAVLPADLALRIDSALEYIKTN